MISRTLPVFEATLRIHSFHRIFYSNYLSIEELSHCWVGFSLAKEKEGANEGKETAEKPKPKAERATSKKVLEEINQLDGKVDSLGNRVESLAASMKAEQKAVATPLQSPWLGLFVVGIAAAGVGTILMAISQPLVGLGIVGIGAIIGAVSAFRLWGKDASK